MGRCWHCWHTHSNIPKIRKWLRASFNHKWLTAITFNGQICHWFLAHNKSCETRLRRKLFSKYRTFFEHTDTPWGATPTYFYVFISTGITVAHTRHFSFVLTTLYSHTEYNTSYLELERTIKIYIQHSTFNIQHTN